MRNKTKAITAKEDILLMMQHSYHQHQQLHHLSLHPSTKLPPLLPPRHLLAQQLNIATHHFAESRGFVMKNSPSICQIRFDKNVYRPRRQRDRQRNQSLMTRSSKNHTSLEGHKHLKSNQSQVLQELKQPQASTISQQQQLQPYETLHQESYYRAEKDDIPTQALIEPGPQMGKSSYGRSSRYGSLSISKFVSQSPEAELIKSLIKSREVDREEERVHIKRRTMSRFDFQSTTMGHYPSSKERNPYMNSKVKQYTFEPWKLEQAEEIVQQMLLK